MKNKTSIMFFFDSEDFTSEHSADAILRIAQICAKNGVTAQFAIVGLLAQQLRAWHREDVMEALREHVIGTHTFGHSFHPNIAEESDFDDFTTAFKTVYKAESAGLELISSILQPEEILFACPPACCKSYVAMYYYASKGIPFYCDSVIPNERNERAGCCNMTHIDYSINIDRMFTDEEPDLAAVLDAAAEKEICIFYGHPHMALYAKHWDEVNYNGKNLHEFGKWEEAPRLDEAQSEKYYAGLEKLIQAVADDERFKITNLKEMKKTLPLAPIVTKDMLPAIYKSLQKKFAPIPSMHLSIADIFCACAAFLRRGEEYTAEKAHGFLRVPFALSQPTAVLAQDVIAAAKEMKTNAFLPEKVRVGEVTMGPADFLFAMLEVLSGKTDEVVLMPRAQLPDISDRPKLENLKMEGWTFSAKFKDRFLSDRLRLQSWTLK